MEIKMKIIHKYNLDFKKTLPYFLEHIEYGNTLCQKIIKKVPFSEGNFFILLPDDADLTKLYQFSTGSMIPTIPYGKVVYDIEAYPQGYQPQQIISMDSELSIFMLNYLKEFNHSVVVENSLLTTEECSKIPHVNMVPYNQEVYYFLNQNNSLSEIDEVIGQSSCLWHFMAIITNINNTTAILLKDEDLDEICDHAQLVIVGAYDGEAYIFWEKA